MFKFTKYKLKGQWYIVAAVLFSFSLLTLFNIFESYSRIDYTSVLKNDEDLIFLNLIEEINKTEKNSENKINLAGDIEDLFEIFDECLSGKGYYIGYNFTVISKNKVNYALTIGRKNMLIKNY